MQSNKTMPWGWVIFWLFIFWPIGLFLLFKKLSSDKSATLKNSKTVSIISYVLIGMGLIYLITAFTEDTSMFIAALIFGGGIWVNIVAKKMKVNGEKYKKYINLVVNQQIAQIDNIALTIGVSYDVAKTDLQKMIDSGYFVGAYINESAQEIILPRPHMAFSAQTNATQRQTQTQEQIRVVTCKSCGANNSIMLGKANECEYCGSPIG